jgi:ATP-binding cassette subfamily B protein
MSYLGMLAWPMMALGWAINVLQRGEASMGRLNKILEEVPEISDIPEAIGLRTLKGKIELRGLTYASGNGGTPSSRTFISPFNRVRIRIVGRTGAGKTVLCDLLFES